MEVHGEICLLALDRLLDKKYKLYGLLRFLRETITSAAFEQSRERLLIKVVIDVSLSRYMRCRAAPLQQAQ